MNYEGFLTWLKEEKKMSTRSARDTISRVKRVLRIVSETSIDSTTNKKLEAASEFASLSMFVKAQLRRAIVLYQEFRG